MASGPPARPVPGAETRAWRISGTRPVAVRSLAFVVRVTLLAPVDDRTRGEADRASANLADRSNAVAPHDVRHVKAIVELRPATTDLSALRAEWPFGHPSWLGCP
jgi:hypothetical protein